MRKKKNVILACIALCSMIMFTWSRLAQSDDQEPAPCSVENVKKIIHDNKKELDGIIADEILTELVLLRYRNEPPCFSTV